LNKLALTAATAVAMVATMGAASARDQIRIVGSSTVFPYSQAVAEEFATMTGARAPVVESTGTGGGMRIFCNGVGTEHPDITGASRAMTQSELALCNQNGVTDITEAMIGYDGLSIAVSRQSPYEWDLTEEQIFRALAADLPNEEGQLIANPNRRWSDIDPSLPDIAIEVFGPPPTSGTRDAFVELVMHDGCDAIPFFQELKETDSDAWNLACSRMRQDGLFIEAGENDNLIVQRLQANVQALGIFGYSFLYENEDVMKPVAINGVEPSFETIEEGSYAVSRPLFVYIKNSHRGVIPGLDDFVREFVSEDAIGPDGYLADRGLTPLSDDEREAVRRDVEQGVRMARAAQ
jgi:phosphate transport system substrate-binding protein